ncbi:SCO2322 family protein [Streptomyces sp. NPDC051207]|uniref:SCO2322 family protein n=1 Tax=Streptomyces sp. NPDC051207 TaxID=3154641 RepID=UPI00342A7463
MLVAVLVLCTGAGAGQAQAADYRYWSFWDRDGDRWTYATRGPSTARPSDGDVQGFRFAVSENSGDAARPRGTAGFAAICASTPEREGRKRVALVLDFGTRADAPAGETPPPARTACASVSPGATTSDALAAVAKPLRYDTNALLCAIGGYPKRGCGEQVAHRESGKRQPATDSGPSLGLVAGGALVAALAAGAVWQVRRRHG